MFSKPDSKTTTATIRNDAEPLARPASIGSVAASLIAENVVLTGDLASDGDVHLDGSVRGDLRVGHLVIGETGQVDGSVEAETVEVRGRVIGSISARSVKLYASAKVSGDITNGQLAIEAGAQFDGRSTPYPTATVETLNVVAAE